LDKATGDFRTQDHPIYAASQFATYTRRQAMVTVDPARDALRVDDEASLARYRTMCAGRDALLDRERDALRALRADLVLANIGWLPIAAAASLGLPAFGACSLNWADVLRARHPGRADVAAVADWMHAAYSRADGCSPWSRGCPSSASPTACPCRRSHAAAPSGAMRCATRSACRAPPA
jgi:hypothetical protein